MKKKVKIVALADRPSLNLARGKSVEMYLDDDLKTFLHKEQMKGLIEVIELPTKIEITLLKEDEEKLEKIFDYYRKRDITSSLEQTASVLLSKAINETMKLYDGRIK